MSQIIGSRVLNFVIHLTPNINPYQATADYVDTFLLPCPLPSWSLYVQGFLVLELIIMFLQSAYIIYRRSKTKKMYHISLNAVGLIQLDRANHCGLCYLLYSIFAVAEIVCYQFAQSGHLDEGWPNFLLGIKVLVSIACARVILWLCICHFIFVRQRAVSENLAPKGRLLSTTATWALNIFLVIIILVPSAVIVTVCSQLTHEYGRVRQVVMPVTQHLRDLAHNCTSGTCSVTHVASQVIVLARVMHHIDRLVYDTTVSVYFYVLCDALTFLFYVPFVYLLFQSFKTQRGLDHSTKRQTGGVFSNTVIELAMIFLRVVLGACTIRLIRNGEFIVDANFWLILRIGIPSTISTLGNITLFLILDSLRKNDNIDPASRISLSRFPRLMPIGTYKSDGNSSV
ncbi:uncharacterized protein MELLADRAFT_71412 [Melampsora larici-populina 98AG31]|uniref:G protein-coupled receptor n=1 Tax=Melampsora larici-populina (strain 98AG31 / pathotype 3-4-7) TaxID=747676 RepID=F4RGF5_MELLP|nr:uncharacterized protein MELLADRAFT_71412 [Melampsora larici-populina 98AG31]EGG08660.1 hypothetical protein MELLADRAFT_71412 [Melampsora larici-populina 98AG31]